MRDQQLPPDDVPEEPEPGQGSFGPLGAGPLVGAGLLGLVLGSVWRPVAERISGVAPTVTWVQGGVLFFVAAVLGGVAWVTWRQVRTRGERLDAQHAVNRLVLARACALVGALVAGVYAGYAVSWVGPDAELARERVWRSAFASVGGITLVVTGKLLERACRVPRGDRHP